MKRNPHRTERRSHAFCSPILAIALSLAAAGHAAPAQQPGDPQGQEGPRSGSIPGGEMVRGTISAINGDRFTVKAENGQTYEIVTTGNTRIMRERQTVKIADLKPGDGVGAAGVLDAPTHTLHAMMLFAVSAEAIRKAQENLGKTYITGRVTAINDLKLTIQRPDGVTQVIEVDEGTSFRRGGRVARGGGPFGAEGENAGRTPQPGTAQTGVQPPAQAGESITLADIKVGDTIYSTGGLHGNVFHPTELHVGAPRRHRAEGAQASAPEGTHP